MRAVACACAAAMVAATGGRALAAPDGQDPPALVDRTLWLPACVTELAGTLSADANDKPDFFGPQATRGVLELRLDARHSFGVIEPFVGTSIELARTTWDAGPQRVARVDGGARVPFAAWGAAVVRIARSSPWNDLIFRSAEVAVEARVPVAAHATALYGLAGIGSTWLWLRTRPSGDLTPSMIVTDRSTFAFATLAATHQVAPSTAFEVGAHVERSGLPWMTERTLDVYGRLLVALARVDLVASVTLRDVTAQGTLPFTTDLAVAVRF